MKNKWVILTNQQLAGVSHAFDVETPRAVNDQSLQSLHMADHPGQTSEKHSEADKHTHITTTTILHTHAHSHNHFTALWILSGTTQVSQYQKKHSPTHTYRGHQSSLICFIHLLRSTVSYLSNLLAWQSFSTISLQVFSGLPLGLVPSTSTPYIHSPNHCLLSQHMPIPSQPVLLQYRDYVI